ncbi:MAG TPA: hypothetical protein VFE33_18650 [Thermoanaerobaculia bacterium]|nr:hypothetical protein [Thermoanaerobaculia bacterium]
MRNRSVLAVFAVSFLVGLSPLSADSRIGRGIDAFTTTSNGSTYIDFAQNPIPADFFCEGSAAFTERMALRGLPLTTGAPGQLGSADTVVERLDDAVFDAKGTAVTRIQFRALSLVSVAPIKTACGAFLAYVSLAGQQRVTRMTIYQTKAVGGTFVAPLAVNARITFIPAKPLKGKRTGKLELTQSITFPAKALPWSFQSPSAKRKRVDSVTVDTDGDLIPDTVLPGTSNFAPGRSPNNLMRVAGEDCPPCTEMVCHDYNGEQHCFWNNPPYCEMAAC